MAEELSFDVFEEILIRLDVKDLIRCKSVCKSWQSFILCPRFVKAQLKRSYDNDLNNHELGHRRIGMGISMGKDDLWGYNFHGIARDERDWLSFNCLHVVGSCNGLVCLSPQYAEFVVTNPSTREQKELPMPAYPPNTNKFLIRNESCWGFGYDSSIDDYKVVVGFFMSKKRRMFFHVLTLKSNTWKFIGQVKYEFVDGISGILCGGALHWFMSNLKKKVIISLDLSTEELKEIPQPADEEYKCDVLDAYKLGVIKGYLCIFWDLSSFSSKKWVMKTKWERYNDHCENKYDVAHGITKSVGRPLICRYVYGVNNGERVPSVGSYIRASIFVKSLVSPHPCVTNDAKQQGKEESSIRKRKRSCKHKKPLIWI